MENILGGGVRLCAVSAAILGLSALRSAAEKPGPPPTPIRNETSAAVETPETTIRSWPEPSRLAARALIAKYGEPDIFGDYRLVWEGNRPWDTTIVHRSAPEEVSGLTSRDVLEQSIPYDVTRKELAALKRFDRRLEFDESSGQLSSFSDSEGLNDLALNLAEDIVAGKRTPEGARDFYRRTIKLSQAGKSSPYMEGFLFRVKREAPLK